MSQRGMTKFFRPSEEHSFLLPLNSGLNPKMGNDKWETARGKRQMGNGKMGNGNISGNKCQTQPYPTKKHFPGAKAAEHVSKSVHSIVGLPLSVLGKAKHCHPNVCPWDAFEQGNYWDSSKPLPPRIFLETDFYQFTYLRAVEITVSKELPFLNKTKLFVGGVHYPFPLVANREKSHVDLGHYYVDLLTPLNGSAMVLQIDLTDFPRSPYSVFFVSSLKVHYQHPKSKII